MENLKENELNEEQKFRKEQQEYNKQRVTQEKPDLCKVEHLEVLDI